MELVADGEPRKCYAHRVGSVQLGPDICRSVFFVGPLGADTHHDFQPASSVGVMRAVSTPWRGATRRIGNSLLGVKCLLHTVCPDITLDLSLRAHVQHASVCTFKTFSCMPATRGDKPHHTPHIPHHTRKTRATPHSTTQHKTLSTHTPHTPQGV